MSTAAKNLGSFGWTLYTTYEFVCVSNLGSNTSVYENARIQYQALYQVLFYKTSEKR